MKGMCRSTCFSVLMTGLLAAGSAYGQVAPQKAPSLAQKAFTHADLNADDLQISVHQMPQEAAAKSMVTLRSLGAGLDTARVDQRTGKFITLTPATPLLPGTGVGNALRWDDLGKSVAPVGQVGLEKAAWNAFHGFLGTHSASLGLDMGELSAEYRIAVHNDGELIQIHAPRMIDGIPVRGSHVSAVINRGNLILMGMHKWADRPALTKASTIGRDRAREATAKHLTGIKVEREWAKPEMLYVPMGNGNGSNLRLVWAVNVIVENDHGSWESLVDARTGQVLAFEDQNHYAEAKGGVLPVTNDGVVPDGVEQTGWPMPYLNVSTGSGTITTDTGGNLNASGSMTAALDGPYVRMNDNCGSISLTQTDGLDFGASSGTDCTTPGFGGSGNTHSSRTGFYELNKIIEMGRGQLPSNSWLQQRLTSNMNINSTCNAFWNGTVNFYRSGGGCANTGEIAGVFDHEWGHGMDANDVNGGIASPSGEGIADIYTALRLNSSCIGRNFRLGTNCSGNGDPCLSCDGVRDIDYLKRQSGQPHDYTWSNNNCGGSVHCVGGVYSEAVWSLWKRKLQSAPYNYDNNTAHEIVNRLTYIGAGATSTWFSGGPPEGGCASASGYMNYIAADDDNGNLNDGTPHMQAIFDAFNDQEIACSTPAVQDAGCAGTPTAAPSVAGSAGNQSASLSWGAVAGASGYEVFRTEGVFGCDFGKVKVAETTGTTFNDSGLQNARQYSYVVIPKGPAASCFGPSSACTQVTPAAAPDFNVSCSPSATSISQGSSDVLSCAVFSLGGYSGSVSLSCAGDPSGVSCGFSPATVSVPADGSTNSNLTLTVDLAQATGSYNFNVQATDGTINKATGIDLQVIPFGSNGPQNAAYDAGLGAPKCDIAGSTCDSGSLLDGRAGLGPEPNASNTLDSCTDGTSGTYHSDESNDRIVVSTGDGGNIEEGDTVNIDVTVWAWSDGSNDTLDLYHTADANNPSWSLIGSFSPGGGGARTISTTMTLPAGSLQAIRANFRYQGSQSSCSGGNYDDADDLVFTVGGGAPECSVDADCNNGLYCDGTETCNAGSCVAGPAPCDDGVNCTVDTCDEANDTCSSSADDALCDNGLFCDGSETCDAALGCQAGTPVVCDDGVGCTVDSCDEGSDACSFAPDNSYCDNGVFCDGTETCDAILGCQLSSGNPCAAGETCDEIGDFCVGSCAPVGDSCTTDSDCCGNKCRGPNGRKTCK